MPNTDEQPRTLSPSELARLAGVSTDTLRYYERKRVLSPPTRLPNGYRRYPAEAVNGVRLVQRSLRVGFKLDELARVLAERQRGGEPCRSVRALVSTRLGELEQRLHDLTALRGELRTLLRDWDRRLARTPEGTQARLLESLPEPAAAEPKAGDPAGLAQRLSPVESDAPERSRLPRLQRERRRRRCSRISPVSGRTCKPTTECRSFKNGLPARDLTTVMLYNTTHSLLYPWFG